MVIILISLICLPLVAQKDYLTFPKQSAMHTATFGVFDSEYDTFDDPLYWMENKPESFDIYNGITDDSYLLGFAIDFEDITNDDIYFQGAYFGFFPTYGSWPTMPTNFDLNFLLGFNDMWSFKFQYFDQNYNTGQGSTLQEFVGGVKLPLNDSILRASFTIAPALHWGGGLRLDYIQPEFIVRTEYTNANEHTFGFNQSILFSLNGPAEHNATDTTGAPVRSQTTVWYHKTWDISDSAKAGIEPTVQVQINPLDFLEPGKTFDGVTLPMANTFNLYIAIPTALTMEIIPEKISFHTGLVLGMFYASYDYEDPSLTGGNYSGWVPVSGLGLGVSLKVSDNIHVQIGSDLVFTPEIIDGKQVQHYEGEFTFANFIEEPLTLSVTVGK